MQLNTDAIHPKTVITGLDFSNFYNQWGFVSIACSKVTTYCEVHRGIFNKNFDTFKQNIDDNGVLANKYYHNDLLNWVPLPDCYISITGPVESNKYQLYLKEIQVYQVLLPIQAILLKINMPVRSSIFPSLIVHLKLDEFSGDYLYNSALDTYNSFSNISTNGAITWHHYLETVLPYSSQYNHSIPYMFCNKENYTLVGDHCEYYECNFNHSVLKN